MGRTKRPRPQTTGGGNAAVHGTSIPLTPDQLLLRGGEVARILGISRALAFRWMQTGVLPTIRVAGARTVRVPREALLEWIKHRTGGGGGTSAPPASGTNPGDFEKLASGGISRELADERMQVTPGNAGDTNI